MPELASIPIVDAHAHTSLRWLEPVELLLFQMDRCGVERTVLVGNRNEFDQSYQQRVFHEHPDRFASAVLVDPSKPDAPRTLSRYVDDGATGMRLHAEARSEGEDPYALWREAERLRIAVSAYGPFGVFNTEAWIELLGEVPNLTIILEYLGLVTGERSTEEDRQQTWGLAKRFPNLLIKLPGLSAFAERDLPYTSDYPFKTPIPPFIEQVYELWGPERILWGSDYPPVSSREGYAAALRYPREELAEKPVSAQRLIFGGNADRVFFG